MFRSQMKAESVDEASQFRYPCYVSEKLDGWRCLIANGTMYTSGGKPFKPPVQERFKSIIEAAHKAKLVLDGELYVRLMQSRQDQWREDALLIMFCKKKPWSFDRPLYLWGKLMRRVNSSAKQLPRQRRTQMRLLNRGSPSR